MHRTRYDAEIQAAAARVGLDPDLVEAVVLQESGGNADAFRFEPDFWNRYCKPNKLYAGRNPRRVSSSYGLMQIMYPKAVELGFDPSLPPETLFVPETALRWGCACLRKAIDWANEFVGVTRDAALLSALAAYNGGTGGNSPVQVDGAGKPVQVRNGVYARQVLAKLAQTKQGGKA